MGQPSFGIPTELVTPGIMVVFAAGFVWAWTFDRRKRYPLLLAGTCLLFAMGMSSQVLHIPRDVGQGTLLSGALYTVAVLVACEAILRRSGATLGWWPHMLALAGIMLLLWYYFYVDRNVLARVYTQNFGYGLMFLITAIALGRRSSHRTIDRVLFWCLLLFALHFFPRTFFTIGFSAPQTVEAFGASAFWKMLQLSLGIFGAGLALTVLAATVTDAMDSLRNERDKDGLTGLLNRRGFEERALQMWGRRKTDQWTLVLCDLDRFKKVNDTYGHSAGDAVLKAFGAILQGVVREQDIVGRIGGEEFALLLPDTDISGARDLSHRIGREIRNARFPFLPPDRRVTASFGITEWPREHSYHEVFRVADQHLYVAKTSGRDSVVVADDARNTASFRAITTDDG